MQSSSDDNEWNAPWNSKSLAIYDCHGNLVAHTGITGNRSRPPDDLVRMASMIADAVNKHLRPDAEALNAVHALRDKQAVVLYFETPADREEFVALIREAKPGMIVKNV